MAMSKEIRRLLGKSRELLWHFLDGQKCFFCHKPILSAEDRETLKHHVRFGNATAPQMELDVTIHHENGNHNDNRPKNRKISHDSCHKTFHAKKVFNAWRKGMVGSSGALRGKPLRQWKEAA